MNEEADHLTPDERRMILRAHISIRDFEDAIRFIEAAAQFGPDATPYEASMIAAVIYYARPWSSNERKPPKGEELNADSAVAIDPATILDEKQLELHKQIVTIRNKAVAHAEWNNYPNKILKIPETKQSGVGIAFSGQRWHIVNERIDLDAFAEIAKKMKIACVNLFAVGMTGDVQMQQST